MLLDGPVSNGVRPLDIDLPLGAVRPGVGVRLLPHLVADGIVVGELGRVRYNLVAIRSGVIFTPQRRSVQLMRFAGIFVRFSMTGSIPSTLIIIPSVIIAHWASFLT